MSMRDSAYNAPTHQSLHVVWWNSSIHLLCLRAGVFAACPQYL